MTEQKFCSECGAKTVEYKHSLNMGLVLGLYRLHKAGGEKNLKELSLTHNQWANFQKLRYWGLVEQSKHENGLAMAGCWKITQRGTDFVKGVIKIPRSVWTYRSDAIRYDGDEIAARDYIPTEYDQRGDYWGGAMPHDV